MKIIWITAECPYPPNTGGRSGIWNRIINLAKNNEIYLFSISESNDEIYKEYIEKYCKEVKFYKRNKRIVTLFKSIIKPYTAISRLNKCMKKDIDDYCQKINPDYIIVDLPQMMGNLSKRLSKKYKTILCQHNIEYLTLKNIANGIHNPIKKFIYKIVSKQLEIYERRIYNNFDIKLFTFVSIEDKKFFEEKYNKYNTLLVPVGAYISENLYKNIDCNDIIFVAKMSYLPNDIAATWFIENVWSKITEKNNTSKFYIVGKDPSESLKNIAKKYNNVIVTGTVDSVDKYYDLAKIVVIPLFNGGGVKVKLLEALGHRKLVVTTKKGIEGTDFVAGEHIIIANNEEEFKEKCLDILENYDKYDSIAEKAFQKIKKEYSWEKIISDFENVLIKKLKN